MRNARQLLIVGGLLCIPAAVAVGIYAYGWADADALRSAPVCRTPNRDSATCMSVFSGKIVERHPGGSKALPSVTVAGGGTTARAGYMCGLSPAGACDAMRFEAGTDISTGWWKGALVALGPSGGIPRVETDQSPEYHLGLEAWVLALVIPAVSFLLEGLLHRRAPATIRQMFESAVAATPQPPRPVDRGYVQRVAWTNYVSAVPVSWALVYIFPAAVLGFGLIDPRLAPVMLVASLIVAVALIFWVTDSYYSDLIRTAAHRSIEVKRTEIVSGRASRNTVITYDLLDGRSRTYTLASGWNGHITTGDRIDALTSVKSGEIRRLVSEPPAQA